MHTEWVVQGYTEDGWEIREPERFHEWDEKHWLNGLVLVTNDDWGGTFGGGRLALHLGTMLDGNYYVAIHGTDDFSMYRRGIPHRQAAEAVLRRIPMVVSWDALALLGFTPD